MVDKMRVHRNALTLASGDGASHHLRMTPQGTIMDADTAEIRDILRRLEPMIARTDERVKVVESRMVTIESRIASLEAGLMRLDDRGRAVETDVAELKGRVSQLPSTWELISTITASQAALLGFTFAILRYASGH